MCKKISYQTRVDADLAIAWLWADLGRDLNKYKCHRCKLFHLTSRQKWTIYG